MESSGRHSVSVAARDSLEGRARAVRGLLGSCALCARRCGVDRLSGELGYCGLGADAHCFREILHYGVELELAPAHAVYLAGCNMRCAFCTAEDWNARPGTAAPLDAAAMAGRVEARRREGARTLMFVGGEPTVSLPAVLDLLARLPDVPTVVWDSNMYMTPAAMDLLTGVVDVYVADLKFGNDGCAEALADAPDYLAVVRDNLLRAEQTASLIVRHLLLPGHFDCCFRPALDWLVASLKAPRLALKGEYMPPQPANSRAPARYISEEEFERARELAQRAGVELVE